MKWYIAILLLTVALKVMETNFVRIHISLYATACHTLMSLEKASVP
jgi:hypothetical protein